MSPIFVRPVREQLEHDRLIRFLQAKYTKKSEAAINVGDEQTVAIKIGTATFFPDLVLSDGKKLTGLVEVETGESVNNLEAMAQWVHFSRARVPFHLYVPVSGYDAAKRLADAHKAAITEIWAYRGVSDGFDLVRQHHDPSAGLPNGKGPAAKLAPVAPKPLPPPPPEPVVVAKPEEPKAPPAKPLPPAKPVAAPVKPAPTAPTKASPALAPATPAKSVPAAKAAVSAKAVKGAKPAKVVKAGPVTKAAKTLKSAKPTKPAPAAKKPAAKKPAPKKVTRPAAKKPVAKPARKAAPSPKRPKRRK